MSVQVLRVSYGLPHVELRIRLVIRTPGVARDKRTEGELRLKFGCPNGTSMIKYYTLSCGSPAQNAPNLRGES